MSASLTFCVDVPLERQKKEIGKRRKPEDQNASKKNKEKKVRAPCSSLSGLCGTGLLKKCGRHSERFENLFGVC